MMRTQKLSRFHKLNKKLVGIGVGIMIVIIILVGIQSYKTVPENVVVPNQTNTQQLPNATLQKPLNAGKHITVELSESMHFAIK